MESNAICLSCQKPLAQDGPMGLCPECLILAGFLTETDADAGRNRRFTAPTIAELSLHFPQLDILDFIGQGGMGAVFKARQKELHRIIALKILPPGIGGNAGFADRFAREARALAKLNHPGIITIYDSGRASGLYFFLMEFVDGLNLRQLLANSRISTREALAIVPQICDALQFAHDRGIIHRDIKPENILLDRLGRVKVADFGLARIIGDAGEEPTSGKTEDSGATALSATGKIIGTPKYMSPEQLHTPGEVDHRADIFALGVVFYELLTGELPGKPPQPPSRKVQIDVQLDEVVLRALEQKPDLRYQQVSMMRTQLERTSSEPSAPTPAGELFAKKPEQSLPSPAAGLPSQFNRLLTRTFGVAGQFWMPILLLVLLCYATAYKTLDVLSACFVACLAFASAAFLLCSGRSSWKVSLEPKWLFKWLLFFTCVSCFANWIPNLVGALRSTSGPVLRVWLADGKEYASVKAWLSAEDRETIEKLYWPITTKNLRLYGMESLLDSNDPTRAKKTLSIHILLNRFSFGVVLDAGTNIVTSFFPHSEISQQNKIMAKILQSRSTDATGVVVVYPKLAVAIHPIKEGERIVGYLAVGRDLLDEIPH